jgi:putative hydrolase of the HAD superfamily
MYLSYQMKVMKPDETFFRRVLMSEKIIPSETLFVDDGPRNVAAASQIGIRTFCPENGSDWTNAIYDYLEY